MARNQSLPLRLIDSKPRWPTGADGRRLIVTFTGSDWPSNPAARRLIDLLERFRQELFRGLA
jgi:hypothetical protein